MNPIIIEIKTNKNIIPKIGMLITLSAHNKYYAQISNLNKEDLKIINNKEGRFAPSEKIIAFVKPSKPNNDHWVYLTQDHWDIGIYSIINISYIKNNNPRLKFLE